MAEGQSTQGLRETIGRVESSVRRFARNDAQDIVQEALTRAVRAGVDCNSEPWLRTVTRRIAIDNTRRAHEVAVGGSRELELLAPSATGNPEQTAIANETSGVIRKALASIPSRYRDVLLTYAEDAKTSKVAERFGISASASYGLLFRARTRLRQELDRVGYAFGLLAFRFRRWSSDIAAAAAICMTAATLISGPTATATAGHAPARRPVVVSAIPGRAGTITTQPANAVTKTTVVPPAIARTIKKLPPIAEYRVHTCGPDGKPLPLGARASMPDKEQHSIVGPVLRKLPDDVRNLQVGTC
jgi:RNA polymerase sigma factor (sigma-70 family)